MEKISYSKLPKKFKKDWLAALRSGKYLKGKGQLHNNEDNTYCCLGVAGHLCKIREFNESSFLSPSYLKGAERVPEILQNSRDIPCKLAKLNDNSKSFKPVINWIEKNL